MCGASSFELLTHKQNLKLHNKIFTQQYIHEKHLLALLIILTTNCVYMCKCTYTCKCLLG